MTIKNIVISGGGQSIITFYGILKAANQSDFWKIENIKNIYGTSAGSLLSVLMALNLSWDVIDNYLIKRPWEKVFHVGINNVVSVIDEFGIFSIESIQQMLGPLFSYAEIPMDITLKDFNEKNGLNIYIYVTELNNFEYLSISHHTHPDWKVVDAVYASCSVPVLFSPIIKDEQCFIDGGILMDFPLEDCTSHCSEEEIFAIKKINKTPLGTVTTESKLNDYLLILLKKCLHKVLPKHDENIKNTVYVKEDMVSIENILEVASSQEIRLSMIQKGEELFHSFFQSL